MGGSSNTGGGNSKFQPPGYVKPYARDLLGQASSLSNQPFQAYTGQMVAPTSGLENQGFNMVSAAAGRPQDPLMGAGSGYLGSVLGGQYLNNNPYIDQMVSRATGDMADQYRYATGPQNAAMASMSGSFDNSGIAGKDMMDRFSLARAMGDAENQIRSGNYQFERGQQGAAADQGLAYAQQNFNQPFQAAEALQQAGQTQRGVEQAGLSAQMQEFQRMLQDPFDKLGALQGAVSTTQGGYGTTKQQSSVPNWAIASTLGGNMMGK